MRERLPTHIQKYLQSLFSSKQLESEYGDCPDCGKKDIEFKVWQIGDGTIKKYKNCPDCIKKQQDEEEAREKMAKQAEIIRRRKEWRLKCGIPPKFMFEDFTTFDVKRPVTGIKNAYNRCLCYAQNFPLDDSYLKYPSLILFSENSWGIGKTHLAISICHEVLNRWNGEPMGCPVKFISEPDLFSQIQATYSYNSEEAKYLPSETDILNQLITVRLLVIDDIGKRKVQDPTFRQRIFFSIIDGRYKTMRPMVITANLNPDGIRDFLGGVENEASADRLFEMTKGKALRLEGESYRRSK